MRIFKETPAKFKTPTMYLFKLGVVATLANIVGLMTKIPGDGPANYYLNPNIAYLPVSYTHLSSCRSPMSTTRGWWRETTRCAPSTPASRST